MTKAKKIVLPNDFERMIPEYHLSSITYGEHMVRYSAVTQLIKGKLVLDIASGSGYGTKLMAETAAHVYGVDVAKDAVEYSKQNYGSKNITYLVGDGVKIPLEDDSVDVVVSFETIEHIEDYEKFIQEVKRVLRKDGLLVLSTPNDLEFAEGNHFHLHEFTHGELQKLTRKYFKNDISYFQGTWISTALFKEEHIGLPFEQSMNVVNAAPLIPEKYLYFFMLCSNRKITETIDESVMLSEHWSARSIQNKNQLTDNHVSNIQSQLASAVDTVKRQEAHMAKVTAEANALQEEIRSIKNSRSWRWTSVLRKTK